LLHLSLCFVSFDLFHILLFPLQTYRSMDWMDGRICVWVCVCVRARARARACMHAYVLISPDLNSECLWIIFSMPSSYDCEIHSNLNVNCSGHLPALSHGILRITLGIIFSNYILCDRNQTQILQNLHLQISFTMHSNNTIWKYITCWSILIYIIRYINNYVGNIIVCFHIVWNYMSDWIQILNLWLLIILSYNKFQ
jgi:hypothetical protein